MYLEPKKKQPHIDLLSEDSFGDFQEGQDDFDYQPNSKVIRKKKKPAVFDAGQKKKNSQVL